MLRFTTPDRRRFLAGTAASTLAAAGPRAVRAADRRKVLRVRSYSDLAVLGPAYRRTGSDHDVFRCLLPALISYKPGADRWEWQLEAAEEIKQLDDTTIAFRLKPGWQWTGGFGELTAEDVKCSYERIADPANESPYHDDWSALDHVEVTGPYTGTIHLKRYFAPLWSTTLPTGSGRIVCKRAVEALPEKTFATSVPATCGPYVLAEWQPKRRTVLRRNPDYKGPQPHFDEVRIHPIDDEEIAEVAYQGGVLDFTSIGLHTFAGYGGQAPAGSALVDKPSLAFNWVGMNVEHPKLRDERVRKAVQRAIDAEAAVDAAYFGRAARANGVVAPGLIGHRDRNLAGHDPAEAKRLLGEAGVKDLGLTMHLLNKTGHLAMARVIQEALGRGRRHARAGPARLGRLLDARGREIGRPLEDGPAPAAPLHPEPGPGLGDRLVHARADRGVELGALGQPRVRPPPRGGPARARYPEARRPLPAHAGPDGGERGVPVPDPRGDRLHPPRGPGAGALAGRKAGVPRVPGPSHGPRLNVAASGLGARTRAVALEAGLA